MRPSELPTMPTPPLAPARPAAPAAASVAASDGFGNGFGDDSGNGFGSRFGSVFRQVQDEVASFIEHGATPGAAAPSLSPEGWAQLARSQPAAAPADGGASAGESASQREFLAAIAPWSTQTAARLGVAPELVAAHAALESGWGRRPLRHGDGSDSNNLFALKAGAHWHGDVAAATTTEYENGSAQTKIQRFRSYPDQASAFRDYAQLLLDNPRYRAALGTGADAAAFAQGLARGGYATDPAYADKLTRLAQRLQRASLNPVPR